jgi:hypothetical protein
MLHVSCFIPFDDTLTFNDISYLMYCQLEHLARIMRLLQLYSCLAIIQSFYDKPKFQKLLSRLDDLFRPLRMSVSQ